MKAVQTDLILSNRDRRTIAARADELPKIVTEARKLRRQMRYSHKKRETELTYFIVNHALKNIGKQFLQMAKVEYPENSHIKSSKKRAKMNEKTATIWVAWCSRVPCLGK